MYYDDPGFDIDYDEEPVFKRSIPFRLETVKISHPIYDPEQVWEFVNQTKVWRDGTQTDLKIKDIKEKQYLFNILKWASKNSENIDFTIETAAEIGKAPGDTMQYDSILELPLFVRIKERYLKLAK